MKLDSYLKHASKTAMLWKSSIKKEKLLYLPFIISKMFVHCDLLVSEQKRVLLDTSQHLQWFRRKK